MQNIHCSCMCKRSYRIEWWAILSFLFYFFFSFYNIIFVVICFDARSLAHSPLCVQYYPLLSVFVYLHVCCGPLSLLWQDGKRPSNNVEPITIRVIFSITFHVKVECCAPHNALHCPLCITVPLSTFCQLFIQFYFFCLFDFVSKS